MEEGRKRAGRHPLTELARRAGDALLVVPAAVDVALLLRPDLEHLAHALHLLRVLLQRRRKLPALRHHLDLFLELLPLLVVASDDVLAVDRAAILRLAVLVVDDVDLARHEGELANGSAADEERRRRQRLDLLLVLDDEEERAVLEARADAAPLVLVDRRLLHLAVALLRVHHVVRQLGARVGDAAQHDGRACSCPPSPRPPR